MKRILIIDDSKTFRRFASITIKKRWPEAEITEYDPVAEGKPDDEFPWHEYGVLLLDYNLGLADEDGLDWLEWIKSTEAPPFTIMLTAQGSEAVAVQAMKSGADDYLPKDRNAMKHVVNVIEGALEYHEVKDRLAARRGQPHPDDKDRVMPLKQAEVTLARVVQRPHNDAKDATIAYRLEDPEPDTDQVVESSEEMLPTGYRFISDLGEKSLSTVILAERIEGQQMVVFKVLDTREANEDPSAFKRFIQEHALISSIKHPNMVTIYGQSFTVNHAYIAMEYFPRGSLAQRIQDGIDPDKMISYVREITYGLRAAHGCGVIHRDLKPSNILFRKDGSLAITDFGIAKVLDGHHDITLKGIVLGTPYYMSPEQAANSPVDQRSDLYSLGILIYQMLTRKRPFLADNIPAILYAHVHTPPPDLPDELSEFQTLLDGLLAKNPEHRFQNADELLEALADFTL